MAKTAGGLRGSDMNQYRRGRARYEKEMKVALGSGAIRNVGTDILKGLRDAGLERPGRAMRSSMGKGYVKYYAVEEAARASIARKYMKQIEEELKRRRRR